MKKILFKDKKHEESIKALRETFGIAKGKFKKTAQEMKDELRRELYD